MRTVFLLLLLCSVAHAQSWTPHFQALAVQTENDFGLPHGICRAFALQESNYDPTAARVEGGYFNVGSRYYKSVTKSAMAFVADYPSIDLVTERVYESMSFGLFQCMGFNLRALGCQTIPLSHLTVEDQFLYFGKFVLPLWKKHHSVAKVASCYNTGSPNYSTAAYAVRVSKYQKQFSY